AATTTTRRTSTPPRPTAPPTTTHWWSGSTTRPARGTGMGMGTADPRGGGFGRAAILTPMPIIEFEGKRPQVHPEAFVAPTATLIGDVVVERGASIWYGAVLRADDCRIVVRENANVQDNSVIHGGPE